MNDAIPSTARGAAGSPDAAPPVDLTTCDLEPIRTPGAIQPHGALLILHADDLTVLHASTNVGAMLGTPVEALLGRPVAALLGAAQARSLARALEEAAAHGHDAGPPREVALAVNGQVRRFELEARRDGTAPRVLLEFHPATGRDALSVHAFQVLARQTIARVSGAATVQTLAQAIAEQMRILTGYDRVWVYRFHEDWHGEIVAESKRPGRESWLGLHYPASDIPRQARALFLEHPVRVIVDRDYVPVPVLPRVDPLTGTPPDLGAAILRSVSPVHVEYMRNMGVRASLVVSLVSDGRLWGLVSGHHYDAPRPVPAETRSLCALLAQTFGAQIGALERVERRDAELQMRSVEGQLLAAVVRHGAAGALASTADTLLLDVVGADGAVVSLGGTRTALGLTPSPAAADALAAWAAGRLAASPGGVASTDDLARDVPAAAAALPGWGGALVVALPAVDDRPTGDAITWLRVERQQPIRWAGDPVKPVQEGGDGARLSPRASFAIWEQEVTGTSTPWSEVQRQVARTFARSVALLERSRARDGAEAGAAVTQLEALTGGAGAGAEPPRADRDRDRLTELTRQLDALVAAVRAAPSRPDG